MVAGPEVAAIPATDGRNTPGAGRSLHILTVVDGCFPGTTGGAELQAGLLSRELLARGHSVEVVAPRVDSWQPEHESIWGIPVRRFSYPQVRLIGAAIMLARFAWWLLRRRQVYDVIHVHMVKNMATVTGLLKPWLRATLVVKVSGAWEFHGGILDAQRRRRPLYRFMNYCVQQADYVQCISEFTRTVLRETRYPEDILRIIPNAVDATAYSRRQVREPMAGRTVVYVGRLEPVKGLDVLLRAWVAVERNVPASRLVIAGAGDQYEQLVQLSKQLGIAEQVHFLGHVQDVMTLLDGADLYVQPSYQEGLSNSLMQAMAMGIAVVATRVSGNVDLVTDGVSGRLVEPGKSEALASAISELLLLPDTAAEMGRRAQLVIRERYDVDVVISKLLQAYRRAL